MMKIGLYGGSFDPIHFGHLNLARELKEKCHLDEVWFYPAKMAPFKEGLGTVSPEHRLCMVQLATQGIPGLRVIDIELYREGPSYTVDTLRLLTEQEHGRSKEFRLLLGADAAAHFSKWKDPEEIIRLAPLCVGCRSYEAVFSASNSPVIAKALEEGSVETSLVEVSSTDVRSRLQSGLPCDHLVPASVLAYISQNNLYSS